MMSFEKKSKKRERKALVRVLEIDKDGKEEELGFGVKQKKDGDSFFFITSSSVLRSTSCGSTDTKIVIEKYKKRKLFHLFSRNKDQRKKVLKVTSLVDENISLAYFEGDHEDEFLEIDDRESLRKTKTLHAYVFEGDEIVTVTLDFVGECWDNNFKFKTDKTGFEAKRAKGGPIIAIVPYSEKPVVVGIVGISDGNLYPVFITEKNFKVKTEIPTEQKNVTHVTAKDEENGSTLSEPTPEQPEDANSSGTIDNEGKNPAAIQEKKKNQDIAQPMDVTDIGVCPANLQDKPTLRQETEMDHQTYGRRAKLSTADPLARLWKENIDFRDEFSKVLNVCYHSNIKYWPHLAQEFGIDEATYKAFSQSDIVSPTESLLNHLETTQPDLSVKGFRTALVNGDAHEVLRVVEGSVEVGDLSEDDLLSEMCDKAPTILDEIILKLDQDDKLWKKVAQASGIPKKTYSAFKDNRTENPTRLFFGVLGTEAPKLRVKTFREKLEKLKLINVIRILDNFKIEDDRLLKNLSENPDAKSAIESILNKETDFLWKLASLYRKEGLMQDIDIETTFRQQNDFHSPTCQMMEYILTRLPTKHTIEDLIIKLIKIKRKDCLDIIAPCLKQKIKAIHIGSSKVKKQAVSNDEPNSVDVTSQSDQNPNPYLVEYTKS